MEREASDIEPPPKTEAQANERQRKRRQALRMQASRIRKLIYPADELEVDPTDD